MLDSFTITSEAAAQIKKICAAKNDPEMKFRIMVLGGGCSGFKYQFEFDKTQNPWDLVFTRDDATVLVDDLSIQFIKDAELHFEKDLSGARFIVQNPNAASGCGCGPILLPAKRRRRACSGWSRSQAPRKTIAAQRPAPGRRRGWSLRLC